MELVHDTLSFLLGTWTLERSLSDHRSGTLGRFEGRATVAGAISEPGSLPLRRARYEEVGEVRYGPYVGRAARSLEYSPLDDAALMVSFTNGQPFVDLDLRGGTWRSTHQCRDDYYEIATVVRSLDVVEERWRVRGPDKDYDAVATLRRVG